MHARSYGPMTGRFLSVDPVLEAKKTIRQPQRWNRYAYAIGNPMVFTDPTGETVYLVTYTAGNTEGDAEFKRAAETLAEEIRNRKGYDPQKDTVLVKGVTTTNDFAAALKEASGLEKTFGKIGELALFSHGGPKDGPTFHGQIKHLFQAQLNAMPTANWEAGASAMFYACNSGQRFAQKFANAQGVTTYGYPTSGALSSRPDRWERIGETGPVYMVGVAASPRTMPFLGPASSQLVPMVQRDPMP